MYLVVIAWLYVVFMMSVAEATNTTGTLLGAFVTFVLYGALPAALVAYLMGTPARRKRNKARDAAEWEAQKAAQLQPEQPQQSDGSVAPDAGGHSATDPVAPVREEK